MEANRARRVISMRSSLAGMVEACDDPNDVRNLYPVPIKYDYGPRELDEYRECLVKMSRIKRGLINSGIR
jgi:hypothetical protein